MLDTKTRAGLQRPDRAHRRAAGGGVFRSAPLRARAAAHLVPQLGLCRPLERGRRPSAPSALSSSAIRRSCWCATMQGALQGFHNTCRHRGAAAVPREPRAAAHRPPSSVRITRGRTTCRASCCAPPRRRMPTGSMWPTIRSTRSRCSEWSGFIFVALDATIRRRSSGMFDVPLNRLDAWPLEGSRAWAMCSRRPSRATGRSSGRTTTSACIARACIRSSRASCRSYGRGLLEERDDPRVERSTQRIRSQVQGRAARRGGDLVDRRAGSRDRRFPACRRRIARPGTST